MSHLRILSYWLGCINCSSHRYLLPFHFHEHIFANILHWRVDVFQVLSNIKYNKIVSITYYILIWTNNGKLHSALKFQYVIFNVMPPQKPKIIIIFQFSTHLSNISTHFWIIVILILLAQYLNITCCLMAVMTYLRSTKQLIFLHTN